MQCVPYLYKKIRMLIDRYLYGEINILIFLWRIEK